MLVLQPVSVFAPGRKRSMATASRAAVRRLALARLISLTGGAAAYLALNYVIYQRTGSATWVAAALFLTFGTVGFVSPFAGALGDRFDRQRDRKSTRLNSSHVRSSYAVFCL